MNCGMDSYGWCQFERWKSAEGRIWGLPLGIGNHVDKVQGHDRSWNVDNVDNVRSCNVGIYNSVAPIEFPRVTFEYQRSVVRIEKGDVPWCSAMWNYREVLVTWMQGGCFTLPSSWRALYRFWLCLTLPEHLSSDISNLGSFEKWSQEPSLPGNP